LKDDQEEGPEVSETRDDGRQTRRQFCTRTCSVAALAALGGGLTSALQGCGGGGGPTSPGGNATALPTVVGTFTNGAITVSIDTASPLAGVGAAALVRTTAGDVLVAHTAADTFVALSSTCTHQTCEITGFASSVFVCPCHGSEFDTSGHVVRGPALSSLRQYTTQFANSVLTITA
jgi:cytochrome b6-f complex iron-sulfur subunit